MNFANKFGDISSKYHFQAAEYYKYNRNIHIEKKYKGNSPFLLVTLKDNVNNVFSSIFKELLLDNGKFYQ
jgi:hypothetical protein